MRSKKTSNQLTDVLVQPAASPAIAPFTAEPQLPTLLNSMNALLSQMTSDHSELKKLNVVVKNTPNGPTALMCATNQQGVTASVFQAKGFMSTNKVDGTPEGRRNMAKAYPGAPRAFLAAAAGVSERTTYRDLKSIRSNP